MIYYTTADCVDHDELDVELISPSLNYTKINDYRTGTSSFSFSLTNLTQDTTVTFTLNVVASSTTSLTVFSTISSFIVSPTPAETTSLTSMLF